MERKGVVRTILVLAAIVVVFDLRVAAVGSICLALVVVATKVDVLSRLVIVEAATLGEGVVGMIHGRRRGRITLVACRPLTGWLHGLDDVGRNWQRR